VAASQEGSRAQGAAGRRQRAPADRSCGEDPAGAAVAFLEALVSAAFDTRIDGIDAAAAARVLLAEEVLLILTGSDDDEAVRAWLRAR